ncbi:MAG: site-specific integrase [Hyphomicrobiales bacterium]
MATIRKRGNRYHVQIRLAGFPSTTKSFITNKDAQLWARQMEVRHDQNELLPNRNCLKQIELSELVIRYLDEVVPNKRCGQTDMITLNSFLKHPITHKALSEITKADFAKYRDKRLLDIKASTLKRELTPLRHMFEIARDEWNIPLKENPLDKLKLKAPDNKRDRRLQAGEYDRLLTAARTRQNPWIEKVIVFAVETAMRRGEILALEWSEVNLKRRSVTILEAKNGHSRTIPLTPKAYALMQGLKREDDRVFPVTKNALKMAWGRMMALSGIDDLRFHDLRHEAVSRFFEMGLTVPEVASISGHRDMKMLMRYAHANIEVTLVKLSNDFQSKNVII